MRPAFAATAAFALVLATPVRAQQVDRGPDATIDAATRSRVIDGVLQRIEEGYVVPARAGEMAQAVRDRARRGGYGRITSAHALADSLTAHLQSVSHDRHLHVVYQSQGVPDEPPAADPTPEERRERLEFGRQVNYGLERAERLAGNVGYLEIRSFAFDAKMVDSSLAAAMNFLGNTQALIVDVRRNGVATRGWWPRSAAIS